MGLNELVEAPDQGAAAGHADAVGGDIGHQLGRRALQHAVDGLQDAGGDLLEGLDHLGGGDGEHPGQAGHEAAALDLEGLLLGPGEDAADLHLDLFRSTFADEHVVLPAYVLDNGLVELVARDLDGGGFHDAAQGDDGDIGGAAADVHDHVAVGFGDVDARADGGGQGLLNEKDPPGAGLNARVHHGALLHLGDAGGHADDHPGLEETEGGGLSDKLLEHPLGHVEVGDDALPQGADGHDVAGGTAQHLLGVGAHLQQGALVLVHGHHGGLPQHHALALDVYENGSGTQIDTDVFCEHTSTSKSVKLFLYFSPETHNVSPLLSAYVRLILFIISGVPTHFNLNFKKKGERGRKAALFAVRGSGPGWRRARRRRPRCAGYGRTRRWWRRW